MVRPCDCNRPIFIRIQSPSKDHNMHSLTLEDYENTTAETLKLSEAEVWPKRIYIYRSIIEVKILHSIICAEILLKWFWLQTNSFLKIWLLCINFEKFAYTKPTNEPTIEKRWALLDGRFIGVNFSKLTHNDQIFRNEFVCNHYHLCKLSAQTIECKIFTPYDLI